MAPVTAREYLGELRACLAMPLASMVNDVCDVDFAMDIFANEVSQANIVHVIGNGGSASDAGHAQTDLLKACGVKALSYQDVPMMTAYANDNGYVNAYASALFKWIGKRDVLIAISSSGESENILNAVRIGMKFGGFVVTFSGFNPMNKLRSRGHLNFYVPSSNYGYVELTHAALLHCLTDRLAAK